MSNRAQKELDWSPTTWEEAIVLARRITDGLGRPIDKGILETVTAFNMLGFPTSQSCEGHLDHGKPYPWVEFKTDECPGYTKAQEEANREGLSAEEEEAAIARLMSLVSAFHDTNHLYTRLTALCNAYYESRPDISEQWRLFVDFTQPGRYRLFPLCAFEENEWPDAIRAERLARGQAEMQAFTSYLKQQWHQRLNNHASLSNITD